MSGTRSYWLDLFTWATWQEFLDAGASVSGFRESRWRTVQRIQPGDYLLCYLTGVSRFIGALEVASKPYRDETPIWKESVFPCRVRVNPVVTLTAETGVPVLELKDRLSVLRALRSPRGWTGHFRGSPSKWSIDDGEVVLEALREAERNPVKRPVDAAKLRWQPRTLKAQRPGRATTVREPAETAEAAAESARERKEHTEIQWLLLKLGSDMGLGLWVARNDRRRIWEGQRLESIAGVRKELPLQFDEATNRTVELIDVLWLRENAIVAAFEIEATTSIYSGLLRMADLLSMQPNLKVPLYLVAPGDRRVRVFAEINRPTFRRLSPPMARACKFIPFEALRERAKELARVARYLNPEFLDELAESCEVEGA